MSRYTFGTNDLAAERLDHVAATFALTSRAVLERARVLAGPCTAVADLGCGPGHTTSMLRELFPDARLVGIDASTEFAARARTRVPDATIEVGDALAVATHGTFDLIYARYLLAHLGDVPAAVAAWCHALAPGGALVLEEPESIRSSDADFARYEQISCDLVRARGGVFYAGPLIAELALPAGIERRVDETIAVDVTDGQAAAMFWRNAAVWADDAVTLGLVDITEMAALVERLHARELGSIRGLFQWRQRQAVFMRASATPHRLDATNP